MKRSQNAIKIGYVPRGEANASPHPHDYEITPDAQEPVENSINNLKSCFFSLHSINYRVIRVQQEMIFFQLQKDNQFLLRITMLLDKKLKNIILIKIILLTYVRIDWSSVEISSIILGD